MTAVASWLSKILYLILCEAPILWVYLHYLLYYLLYGVFRSLTCIGLDCSNSSMLYLWHKPYACVCVSVHVPLHLLQSTETKSGFRCVSWFIQSTSVLAGACVCVCACRSLLIRMLGIKVTLIELTIDCTDGLVLRCGSTHDDRDGWADEKILHWCDSWLFSPFFLTGNQTNWWWSGHAGVGGNPPRFVF